MARIRPPSSSFQTSFADSAKPADLLGHPLPFVGHHLARNAQQQPNREGRAPAVASREH
jgi:hypothetical protein